MVSDGAGDVDGVAATVVAADDDGIEVVDPVERTRVRLETTTPPDPVAVSTDAFPIPLDTAVAVRTDEVALPVVVAVHVQTLSGELVTQTEHFAYEELPDGEYLLDIAGPIKLYLRVSGPLTVRSDADRTVIALDGEREVTVGARSFHDSPAGTITTTDDPVDVMRAVSTFGHALKTRGPDRSYPTLRGHPPRVKLGEELDVPPGLEPPETPVTVELPPSFEYVYPAASLAYYLGAKVVPGERPLIRVGDFTHSLSGPDGFETTVARTLKTVFVLDCAARTEGYYDVPLFERAALDNVVDVPFADLYEMSTPERLRAYLDVDYEAVEPYCPAWKLTADVTPTAEHVELLPYLVDDLAVVRTPEADRGVDTTQQVAAVDEFVRGGGRPQAEFVRPEPSTAIEQTWAGDGMPIGASKALLAAYENRLDRTVGADDITITVVCNAAEMNDERDVVDDVYGSRAELPFEVRQHEGLTRAELRSVLATDTDFLHYIGHIDEDGIECADGKLDPASIPETGVDAFLLNACSSYEVGTALVEAGAIGGIVTLSDVLNGAAVTMGRTLARLLNVGYPLGVALEVARDESYAGGQYVTVGDGGLAIAQPKYNLPDLVEITDASEGRVDVTYRTFLTTGFGVGTLMMPTVRDESQYYLAPVANGLRYDLSVSELVDFVFEKTPIRYDGALHWAESFDFGQLD